MFHASAADEIYLRGESQLRVPASLRAAVTRDAMAGTVAFMQAAMQAQAKAPRWWNKRERCSACASATKAAPKVVTIVAEVALSVGPRLIRLLTPGFECPCGAVSYVRRAEVRELANDVLVSCDISFGALPGGEDERRRRRAEVRRIQ